MERSNYRGSVRDSAKESERDVKMLTLHGQGVPVSVIAQRMGVTVTSVRMRIKRARARRDGPSSEPSDLSRQTSERPF